jgi:hypothetical protein
MSEKNPQSNPENIDSKKYFIPMGMNQFAIGVVNFDRQAIYPSKQRSAPDLMITMVEVTYSTINAEGETVTETKMISDHLLTDDAQADLRKKYLKSTDKNEED